MRRNIPSGRSKDIDLTVNNDLDMITEAESCFKYPDCIPLTPAQTHTSPDPRSALLMYPVTF